MTDWIELSAVDSFPGVTDKDWLWVRLKSGGVVIARRHRDYPSALVGWSGDGAPYLVLAATISAFKKATP